MKVQSGHVNDQSRKNDAIHDHEESREKTEKPKGEKTEEEKEAIRKKRLEKRQQVLEKKRRLCEEKKRLELYQPKSEKILLVKEDLFRAVRDTSQKEAVSRQWLSQQNSTQNKSLKFFDEEYPSLGETRDKKYVLLRIQKNESNVKKVSSPKFLVDSSGSEWETEDEANEVLEEFHHHETEVVDIAVETGAGTQVKSILKDERKKSFAAILAASSNPMIPETVKPSAEGQPRTARAEEKKKVKRNDPLSLDLFQALQVASKQKKLSKKSSQVVGSKLRNSKNSKSDKFISSGNALDSSAPSRRRGKEREFPKKKKKSKMKKIILNDRQKRTLLRLQLANLSLNSNESQKGKNRIDNLNAEPQQSGSNVEVVRDNVIEVERFSEERGQDDAHIEQDVPKEDPADLKNVLKSIHEEGPLQKAKRMIHSRKFRDYCDHLLCSELDNLAVQLMEDLVRFQDRQYFMDPVKGKMKRRYVAGLREIKKYLIVKKISALLIAPDVENVESEGGLNDVIAQLRDLGKENDVPCFFVLNRRKLGKACRRKVPVSAIGIFNYQGSDTNFHNMMELLPALKAEYELELNKALNDVLPSRDKES